MSEGDQHSGASLFHALVSVIHDSGTSPFHMHVSVINPRLSKLRADSEAAATNEGIGAADKKGQTNPDSVADTKT